MSNPEAGGAAAHGESQAQAQFDAMAAVFQSNVPHLFAQWQQLHSHVEEAPMMPPPLTIRTMREAKRVSEGGGASK